ncbi:sigma-70 family RNA polymerase sigma factor [bacterium]|nr:sigma-70 family RNA polymerase sigma factor [bacterium]
MTTTRPSANVSQAVYQRLKAGEPDAPADVVELFLEPLIAALRSKYPQIPDPLLINDIVTDSLFHLIQHPERYILEKGSLWNYLFMDALGDLRNAWEKENRRLQKEIPFDPVAHDQPDRNIHIEEQMIRQFAPDGIPTGMTSEEVLARLRAELSDPQDWAVLELMAFGERSTEQFASVLGITHYSVGEQRRIVKQTKDRLRIRLKRWGAKLQ